EERKEIFDWLNAEENSKREKQKQLQADIERLKKTDNWLRENREKYMNQWVCLDGDKLIAHGEDGQKVYRQAKEKRIEVPFMHHFVKETDWGGWL
ncbi:MAG: DUF5678 domain-containing protein, partial [Acidobacteriota bacterium]